MDNVKALRVANDQTGLFKLGLDGDFNRQDAGGDSPRARERLAHLLSTGEAPQWTARYLRQLIQAEAFDEALIWLVKLERHGFKRYRYQ